MKTVTLIPKPNASRRTLNRVKEHPAYIRTGEESTNIIGYTGRRMIRFVNPVVGWPGENDGCWLPADEIEMGDMQGK